MTDLKGGVAIATGAGGRPATAAARTTPEPWLLPQASRAPDRVTGEAIVVDRGQTAG